jgi:hypothetical protein
LAFGFLLRPAALRNPGAKPVKPAVLQGAGLRPAPPKVQSTFGVLRSLFPATQKTAQDSLSCADFYMH